MSSHYFVKEEQEPVLLIMDADAIPFEKVQELLEWNPTVMVLESAIVKALGWQIKIDLVIVPSVRLIECQKKLLDQVPLRFITFGEGENPLIKVLLFLRDIRQQALNILTTNRDMMMILMNYPDFNCEVFCHGKRWMFIKSGQFERWLPRGAKIYLYPEDVSQRLLTTGIDSSWIVESQGQVTVSDSRPFWIGESIGE